MALHSHFSVAGFARFRYNDGNIFGGRRLSDARCAEINSYSAPPIDPVSKGAPRQRYDTVRRVAVPRPFCMSDAIQVIEVKVKVKPAPKPKPKQVPRKPPTHGTGSMTLARYKELLQQHKEQGTVLAPNQITDQTPLEMSAFLKPLPGLRRELHTVRGDRGPRP